MKRIITYLSAISGILFSCVFSGCISEYEPKNIEEVRDLLVIDGSVTDGESSIVLRHSVGLTEHLTGEEYLDGANVYVETDAGDIFTSKPEGGGRYVIPTGDLDAGKQYRLNVIYNDEHYQSTFLAPLFTPEIDSIFATKKGYRESVYMCVDTHDPENKSRYYRWSYRETWEVRSELYANARWENGKIISHNLNTSENTYYCWARDSSKILHLGSTDKLSENVVREKRLLEIDPTGDRLSIMYHFVVEQNQIRKETYDYLVNLQKNVEQTGGIFTPIPSEMKGNISCITNPDLPVIGFVEVATTVRKDRYFPQSDGLYEATPESCSDQITSDSDYAPPFYAFYEYYPPINISYVPHSCVDCRTRQNAGKRRPEDWPLLHY